MRLFLDFLSYLTMLLYSFMIAFGADLIKSQWILSPNRMIGKSSRNRNISVHLFCQQKFVLFTISIYSFACTHLVRVPRASFSHYIITATRLPTVFFFFFSLESLPQPISNRKNIFESLKKKDATRSVIGKRLKIVFHFVEIIFINDIVSKDYNYLIASLFL